MPIYRVIEDNSVYHIVRACNEEAAVLSVLENLAQAGRDLSEETPSEIGIGYYQPEEIIEITLGSVKLYLTAEQWDEVYAGCRNNYSETRSTVYIGCSEW